MIKWLRIPNEGFMRKLWMIALLIVPATNLAGGQDANPNVPVLSQRLKPDRAMVYSDGPGITVPALLPLNMPRIPLEECQNKVDGTVLLSVIVDSVGEPRDLWFLRAMGNDIDKLALEVAAHDRFTPGTINGSPVAVAQSLELSLNACRIETKDPSGATSSHLELHSQPTQSLSAAFQPPKEAVLTSGDSWSDSKKRPPRTEQVGGNVAAPIVLISPQPQLTDEARRAKYQGVCIVSLIVDRNGMPQDVKLVRNLDYGLGVKAIEAMNKARFKPAMKQGEPVPAFLNVKMEFRLYAEN
jgi:TonB family protein